jgi:hypothetical protein
MRKQSHESRSALPVIAKFLQRRFDRGVDPDCILFFLSSAKILVIRSVNKIAKVEFHRILPRHNAASSVLGMVNPPRVRKSLRDQLRMSREQE